MANKSQEEIKLRDQLMEVPESAGTHPVPYQARTGHVLPHTNSEVYKQLRATEEYANQNKMKINYEKKTKTMLLIAKIWISCLNWKMQIKE